MDSSTDVFRKCTLIIPKDFFQLLSHNKTFQKKIFFKCLFWFLPSRFFSCRVRAKPLFRARILIQDNVNGINYYIWYNILNLASTNILIASHIFFNFWLCRMNSIIQCHLPKNSAKIAQKRIHQKESSDAMKLLFNIQKVTCFYLC